MGVARWSINMGVQSLEESDEIENVPWLYSARLSGSMHTLGLSGPTRVVESLDDIFDGYDYSRGNRVRSYNKTDIDQYIRCF